MSTLNQHLQRLAPTDNTGSMNEWCEFIGHIRSMEKALEKIRDCDWVITLPDRMDAVRDIARKALKQAQEETP